MKSPRPRLAYRLLLGAALALLGVGGCGPGQPPTPDPDAAHNALRSALEAWKEGKTPDALTGTTPAIHVSDWRWKSGVRLIRYEIDERDHALGTEVLISAQLWIDSGKGKTLPEKVSYNVGTNPALTVTRATGL